MHRVTLSLLDNEIELYRDNTRYATETMAEFHGNSFIKDMNTFCAPVLDNAHTSIRSLIKFHEMLVNLLAQTADLAKELDLSTDPASFEPYVFPLQMDTVHKHIKNHDDKNIHRSSLRFIIENARNDLKDHIDDQLQNLSELIQLDINVSYQILADIDSKADTIFSSLDLKKKDVTPTVDEIFQAQLLIYKFASAVNELTVNHLMDYFLPANDFAEQKDVTRLQLKALRHSFREVILYSDTFDNVLKRAMEKSISVS